MKHMIEKAGVLIEALPYIQRFRGETVVVKFGGSVLQDESGYRAILEDIAFMECVGLCPVIVHGGGKAISEALRAKRIEPNFEYGLRVTDDETIKVVETVLNHQVNPLLTRTLASYGGKARGIHGEDILKVTKHTEEIDGELRDWGYVGSVTDVDIEPIQAYLNADIIPVITPLGRDENGQIHNINADAAATAIARALKARKLVFLSDVPGLLRDPSDRNTLISTLAVGEVESLIESNVISGGMRPKIQGAVDAIHAGINKAHIIDADMPHSLLLELFTEQGVGTQIVH